MDLKEKISKFQKELRQDILNDLQGIETPLLEKFQEFLDKVNEEFNINYQLDSVINHLDNPFFIGLLISKFDNFPSSKKLVLFDLELTTQIQEKSSRDTLKYFLDKIPPSRIPELEPQINYIIQKDSPKHTHLIKQWGAQAGRSIRVMCNPQYYFDYNTSTKGKMDSINKIIKILKWEDKFKVKQVVQ